MYQAEGSQEGKEERPQEEGQAQEVITMVVMRCACTKAGGAKGRRKTSGRKKAHKPKRKKTGGKKRGCRVAGVSVPKKACGCVRREMKGVRGSKEMKKRLARNAISQCKRE